MLVATYPVTCLDLSRDCLGIISAFGLHNSRQTRDVVLRLFVCTVFSVKVLCLAARDYQTILLVGRDFDQIIRSRHMLNRSKRQLFSECI